MNPALPGPSDPSASDSKKAVITIPIDEFVRNRDGVVTGLSSLISGMNELIRSYLTHTNKMLGETSAPSDLQLNMSKLFSDASGLNPDGTRQKRKRQRREKDPNAPKRPLTAYFLYATSARPLVKQVMPGASAAEINGEILRRWKTMAEPEKSNWKDMYETNAAKYRLDVAEYKANHGVDPTADEDIDAPGDPDLDLVAAGAQAASDSDAGDSDSDEEGPAKVPTPPPAKKAPKRKGKQPTSPSPSAQLVPAKAKAEKRKKDNAEAAVPSEEPKKKKPRKSDATKDAPKKEKKKRKSDA